MLVVPTSILGAIASAGSSSQTIAPALIFMLGASAAVGLILLLPGRLESSFRKIGAVLLIAVAIVFAVVLGKAAAGMNAYFWIFAAVAVFSAVRVITHPRPVYSALYFVMTIMASAGLFVLMWAEFMAAALVIIYGGAILITYVFVIMLASQAAPAGSATMAEQLADFDANSREPIVASAVGMALLGVLLFLIFDSGGSIRREIAPSAPAMTAAATITTSAAMSSAPDTSKFIPLGNTQNLGAYLFTNQLVNMELAGLLLTLAMVGAIVIARSAWLAAPLTTNRSQKSSTRPRRRSTTILTAFPWSEQ